MSHHTNNSNRHNTINPVSTDAIEYIPITSLTSITDAMIDNYTAAEVKNFKFIHPDFFDKSKVDPNCEKAYVKQLENTVIHCHYGKTDNPDKLTIKKYIAAVKRLSAQYDVCRMKRGGKKSRRNRRKSRKNKRTKRRRH